MDGVLADFEKGFLQAWKRRFPKNPHIPLEERKTFSVLNDYPNALRKDVESIYKTRCFFQNLPIIHGGKEALVEMQKLNYEVFVCTSLIRYFENCVLEKYHWVAQNLGYEWIKRLIVAKDKTLIYGNILIDDKPEHGGLRKPAWKHVLFDRPYNKDVVSKLRITWENWKEVLNL